MSNGVSRRYSAPGKPAAADQIKLLLGDLLKQDIGDQFDAA